MPERIPNPALYLGAAGLLPFFAATAAIGLLPPEGRGIFVAALAGYGAVILSFLGAVHWGAAIGGTGGPGATPSVLGPRLAWSVVPALLGWASLVMGAAPGLVLQLVGFVGCLIIDVRATRLGLLPAWYPKLRWPLSAVAILCLAVALGLLLIG
jgi:hypothetical protein